VAEGYFKPLQIKGWERAFWEFSTAPRDNKLVENLTDISHPTLLITGKYDVVVPTKDTVKLSKVIKNNKLIVVDKSGHLPQEEQPKVFTDSVIKWVKATN